MFRYSHLKSELPYSFNSISGGDGIDIRSLLILGYMIAQSIEIVKLQKKNLEKNTNHNGHQNKAKSITETTSQTQKLSSLIENFSKFDIPILITGEVGTEKELIARTLHYQSSRGSYPFIGVKCSSFSESLLQKELFGSENGASPNLVGFHKGKLELAEKGTIFLDDVTEIDLKTQKLFPLMSS
jgi:DNA-binding NtrC family response regulator